MSLDSSLSLKNNEWFGDWTCINIEYENFNRLLFRLGEFKQILNREKKVYKYEMGVTDKEKFSCHIYIKRNEA
jgi:hypothetical protein